MSGRAFLNVIETDLLSRLDGESRALMHWSLHDPTGFAAEQQRQMQIALVDAGGEIG